MNNVKRRDFIKGSLVLGAAAAGYGLLPTPATATSARTRKMSLGFQVWTIREKLQQDFEGTLRMMAGLGYDSVEMCSPPGYGFQSLLNIKAKEMRRIMRNAGLKFESSHYGIQELRTNLDERIAFALESGQKHIIVAHPGLAENAPMSDWMRVTEELNKIGMRVKQSGLQLGYHNHHGEFAKINGTLIYDILLKELDPEYVAMQFQVAVISVGYKASTYFRQYPGRFISAHLADWSPSENKNVAMGKGVVDWKEFFDAAKTGGLTNIYVEMDEETFADSADYYHHRL